MNADIFLALAQSLGRLDLAGPLSLGFVATDLFAFALGLKRPSSLFKKLEDSPQAFPPLYELPGSRRKYFKLVEIEAWYGTALQPISSSNGCPSGAVASRLIKAGRPSKLEKREATRRGMSVKEYRLLAVQGRQ